MLSRGRSVLEQVGFRLRVKGHTGCGALDINDFSGGVLVMKSYLGCSETSQHVKPQGCSDVHVATSS
jgi:hypothetical protein